MTMGIGFRIGTLTALLACIHAGPLAAQTLDTPVVLDIESTNKSGYFKSPFAVGEHLVMWQGAPKKEEKGTLQYVMHMYDWQSRTHDEVLLTAPDLPGEEILGLPTVEFGGSVWALVQAWDKKTGAVDLYAQAYDRKLVAQDAPIKIGTVNLEPKGYWGQPLGVEALVSPDGSKLVFYFDGIQAGNIKLAMCWAMDRDMEPIWDGAYRLPVQSLGATTTPHFFNDGSVSVTIRAVELDEESTKEKRDGTVEAKVEKTVGKNMSTALYVLRGETFFKLDGAMLGAEKMSAGELLYTDAGWSFVAFLEHGSGRERRTEWVHGTLGAEGVVVTSRNPVDAEYSKYVYLDEQGFFFVVHEDDKDEELYVSRVAADGSILWTHHAPYGSSSSLHVVNGRLIDLTAFSKTSLERVRNGEAPKADANVYISLYVMVSWHEGQRNILLLVPEDSDYKDSAFRIDPATITDHGFAYKGFRQDDASMTFLPISW
jgi:hypothetical protein